MPTQNQVADHLDLGSTRYVRELRDAGKIPDPRTATMDEIRVAYLRGLRDEAAGRGAGDASRNLTEERGKLLALQRRREELRNLELEGAVLPVEDVIATWANRIAACKRRLRAIHKTAIARLRLNRKQGRGLLALIDEALDELAGNGTPPRRGGGPGRGSVGSRKR